ncbi:P-loop containing nucleoside triphosphate hydrolase protein [Hyaloscypha bicolor E]|uniref:P-loop containing nucleoside triphosphate hydrolase protein n=1 Tax=Hyaloscypha bicolor E TaxID=1095630 RepID=A0A2J6SKJ3_9HELO|nr:P-loop containing nucleoside triphosphate hydrolase protein [Hyaloscypha bicolor E]PMD51263.1 P-loop containing nucleoside triphosphate hydrolase protein [Hyaloscypha bicolor E]
MKATENEPLEVDVTARLGQTRTGGSALPSTIDILSPRKNNPNHTVTADTAKATSAPHSVGSISQIKEIYRSPDDKDDTFTWLPDCPPEIVEAAENDESAKFAIILRHIKSNDSDKKLEAHSIVIQSPWLQRALAQHVLSDYPGVTCEMKRLIFEAPFKPLIHRWQQLLNLNRRRDLDPQTTEHVRLLQEFLMREIEDSIKAYDDYIQNGVVTWDHLWMIFQPGCIAVFDRRGECCAFEVDRTEYKEEDDQKFLRISCDGVDWSGTHFGRVEEPHDIHYFPGTRNIHNLPIYPLKFHEERKKVEKELTERGKVFEELAGYKYKGYNGIAITWDDRGKEKKMQIDGRIIIDTDSFNRYSPYPIRHVKKWKPKDVDNLNGYQSLNGDEVDGHNSDDPPRVKLSPHYQMLCRSRVRGYALKEKEWLDFFVERIAEIKWNAKAFESLVLPPAQKGVILALSESQLANKQVFDDIIQGKGKGITILLSGPPGTGKTLTAEAVAEKMRVPLHAISFADLGPRYVWPERQLQKILELVSRWKAILLLDECDVFLEKRSADDLNRNSIVTAFLRTIEYYEGLMFMTTNRAENIDEAVKSRIHLSINYPDLDEISRRQIWSNLLKVSTLPHELSEQDLDKLAQERVNGRQIKNRMKMAQLLAAGKREPLKRTIINTVIQLEEQRLNSTDVSGKAATSSAELGSQTQPIGPKSSSGNEEISGKGQNDCEIGQEPAKKRRRRR